MYSKLADKFAQFLILKFQSDISDDRIKNVQVISYGIQIIVSSIVNLLLVLVLGSYLWGWVETLIFILFFCPIRQYSGGYHAKTFLSCTVGFLGLYSLISGLVYSFSDLIVCIFICIICMFIIGVVSPIETENKRINKSLKKKCRKKIIFIICFDIIVILIFAISLKFRLVQTATIALSIECVLLGLGMFVNKRR